MKKNQTEKVPPEFASLCEPFTPVGLMLALLNDDGMPLQLRIDMAKSAAPYVHARLAAVERADPPPQYSLDLSKLNDDELFALERMVAKAQVLMPAEDDLDVEESASGERPNHF